jgi:hypothetical protein
MGFWGWVLGRTVPLFAFPLTAPEVSSRSGPGGVGPVKAP